MTAETTEPVAAPVRSRLARRVLEVPPSGIRKFFDVIATMPDVISLGIGEPDFTTPPQIIEEGVRSLRSGRTHYTSNYGTIELRRALSRNLERLYGVALRPGRRDPGHHRRLGGPRHRLRRDHRPGRRGHPPRALVRGVRARASRSRAVCRCSCPRARRTAGRSTRRSWRRPSRRAPRRCSWATPATPPAPCWSRRQLRAIADIAAAPRPHRHQRRDLRPTGVRRAPARGVQRPAGHARPDHPARRLLQGLRHDRLAGRLRLRAKGPHRGAGQGPPVPDHVRADHRPGRGARRAHGRGAGCPADGRRVRPASPDVRRRPEPDRAADGRARGAFYAFPRISGTGLTSEQFSERLLFEHQVAVVPGSAFGPSGEGFVRASLATSYEQLEEALVRIERFVSSLG